MSVEAMVWVLEEAPDFPPHLLGALMGLANKADKHGRGAWPGQDLLAQWARKTPRAIRNDLAQAEDLGLIRRGDQSLVSHLVADERPVVWDLAVERKREREGKPTSAPSKDRKHTSGRKHTSAPSDSQKTAGQETSTGTVVPPGTVLPAEGTGSVVQRDRKHTSANTSLIHPEPSLPTEEKGPDEDEANQAGQLFDVSAKGQKPKKKRATKAEREEKDRQAQDLAEKFFERYRTAQTFIAVRQVVRGALGNGYTRDELAFVLKRLGDQKLPVSGASIQLAHAQISEEQAARNGTTGQAAPRGFREPAPSAVRPRDRWMERQ